MVKSIETINSAAIEAFCAKHNITAEQITLLQSLGEGEMQIWVYELPYPGVPAATQRVAITNGDPVWEEDEPSTFAELLESLA